MAQNVVQFDWFPNYGFCYKSLFDFYCKTLKTPSQDWLKIDLFQAVSSFDVVGRDHCFIGDQGAVFCNNLKKPQDLYSTGGLYVKVIEAGATQIFGHPQSNSFALNEVCLVIHQGDLKNCRENFTGSPLSLNQTLLRGVGRFSYRYPNTSVYALQGTKLVYSLLDSIKNGTPNFIDLSNTVKSLVGLAVLTTDNRLQNITSFSNSLSSGVTVSADTTLVDPEFLNRTFYISNKTLFGAQIPLNQPIERLFVGTPICALSKGHIFCQLTSTTEGEIIGVNYENTPRWEQIYAGPSATDFKIIGQEPRYALCIVQGGNLSCKGHLQDRFLADWTLLRNGVKSLYEGLSYGSLVVRNLNNDLEVYREKLLPTTLPIKFVRVQSLRP